MNVRSWYFLAMMPLALASHPAAATAYIATYTGTISSGYDTTGVFGTANSDLTGKAFVASYRFDPALGLRTIVPGFFDHLRGGSLYSVPTPLLDSSVQINGITVHFQATLDGEVYAQVNDLIDLARYEFHDSSRSYQTALQNHAFGLASPPSVVATLNASGITTGGYFQNFDYDNIHGRYVNYVFANFTGDTVTVAAVPEPASWALMIGGFGMVGGALRSRRQVALKQFTLIKRGRRDRDAGTSTLP